MLPSAKSSLQKGGFSPKAAAWTLIACFIAGAVGIQLVSRIIHRFIPHQVVDCEHSHDEEGVKHDEESAAKDYSNEHNKEPRFRSSKSQTRRSSTLRQNGNASDQHGYFHERHDDDFEPTLETERAETFRTAMTHRPSFQGRVSATFRRISSRMKESCDHDGPCHGVSEPCGQECFKILNSREDRRLKSQKSFRRPPPARSASTPMLDHANEITPLLKGIDETPEVGESCKSQHHAGGGNRLLEPTSFDKQPESSLCSVNGDDALDHHKPASIASEHTGHENTGNAQHHHHVPTNAFLAIGLQTSIAIALHKLPEGFITYATNHANPQLGFSVFLALFIHNITEGFAMALPLYLAINSRWKAMFWSSLLGGFSQPLGAGIAALWFKVAGSGDSAPGEGVYGGMFAVTAGIMTSVALQLFSESLDLTHNRNLCMIFAFVGMGVLGVSSALTA